MKRLVILIALTITSISVAFGQNLEKPAHVTPISLEDRRWTLDSIGGKPVSEIGRTAFLNFDKAKQSAGGDTSCNVFGGNYTTKGSTLKFSGLFSTMMACLEDDRMTIERDYLDALEKVNRYEIANGKLMLFQDKRLLLTMKGERK